MKYIFILVFLIFSSEVYSQNNECQVSLRIDIIDNDCDMNYYVDSKNTGFDTIYRWNNREKTSMKTIIELLDCRGKLNFIQYYEFTGKLRVEGKYINCIDTLKTLIGMVSPIEPYRTYYEVFRYFQPLRDGHWIFYNEDRSISREEFYDKGTLMKIKFP